MLAIRAPVSGQDLFNHHHQLLVCNLPILDPYLYCAQGFIISINMSKVASELRANRKEKARLLRQQERKGPQKLFGAIMLHLLNLDQTDIADELPPLWNDLAMAKK